MADISNPTLSVLGPFIQGNLQKQGQVQTEKDRLLAAKVEAIARFDQQIADQDTELARLQAEFAAIDTDVFNFTGKHISELLPPEPPI